ncbi:MAG: hypothetical protein J7621_26000 [Niastella sp.]|nr:hypothetical protein [Niastella sp.]
MKLNILYCLLALVIVTGRLSAQSTYSKTNYVLPNGNYYLINVETQEALSCPEQSNYVTFSDPDETNPNQLLMLKKSGKGFSISLAAEPTTFVEFTVWGSKPLISTKEKSTVFVVTDAGDGSYYLSVVGKLGRACANKNHTGKYTEVVLGTNKTEDAYKWLIVPESQLNAEAGTDMTYAGSTPATGNTQQETETHQQTNNQIENNTTTPPANATIEGVAGKAKAKDIVRKHARDIIKESGAENKLKEWIGRWLQKVQEKADKVINQ